MGKEPAVCSSDRKGSKVFNDAWNDYLDTLKGYFSNGMLENDQNQIEEEDEDCPTLRVTWEEYELWCAPCRKSLIIKLLGKTLPLWIMKTNLERIWKTKQQFTTRDLDNGFFVVSFDDEEDMNMIYQEGPWTIADRYLIVQRWRPNFDPWNAEIQKKIAAWVRIPLLPLEFFNTESLRRIGKLIGRTLKVDMITYTGERGRFALICVELDLQRRLKSGVTIFGTRRIVEYEGLHLICFNCGKYGHHHDVFPEKYMHQEGSESDPQAANKNDQTHSSGKVHVDLNTEPKETAATQQENQHKVSESGIPKRANEEPVIGNVIRNNEPPSERLGVWNLVQRSRGKKFGNNVNCGTGGNNQEKSQ